MLLTVGRTASINMDWLKSSVKLLESALRERNKQMEIQSREIEFLRKELRRKDDIMKEYENIIKDREDMEKRELEILHQEIKSLRMDVMSKVITIREQENMIEQLENKAEKLMSIMPPPSIPRARAQGVSAEPKGFAKPTENLRRFSKNERWVSCVYLWSFREGDGCRLGFFVASYVVISYWSTERFDSRASLWKLLNETRNQFNGLLKGIKIVIATNSQNNIFICVLHEGVWVWIESYIFEIVRTMLKKLFLFCR